MKKYIVDLTDTVRPKPDSYEMSAAYILANYFKKNGRFVPRTVHKTPDVEFGGISWEIKSPLGRGKRNIQHQIERAAKQSENIVIDARRTKKPGDKVMRELSLISKTSKRVKRLILITKSGKIIEFKKSS
jgi:hypothetical protein